METMRGPWTGIFLKWAFGCFIYDHMRFILREDLFESHRVKGN